MTIETDTSTTYTDPGVDGMVSDWSSDRADLRLALGQVDDVDLPAQ